MRTTSSLPLYHTPSPFPSSPPSIELHSSWAHILWIVPGNKQTKNIQYQALYNPKWAVYRTVVRLAVVSLPGTLFVHGMPLGRELPYWAPQGSPPPALLLLAVKSVLPLPSTSLPFHCAVDTAILELSRPASVEPWPLLKL